MLAIVHELVYVNPNTVDLRRTTADTCFPDTGLRYCRFLEAPPCDVTPPGLNFKLICSNTYAIVVLEHSEDLSVDASLTFAMSPLSIKSSLKFVQGDALPSVYYILSLLRYKQYFSSKLKGEKGCRFGLPWRACTKTSISMSVLGACRAGRRVENRHAHYNTHGPGLLVEANVITYNIFAPRLFWTFFSCKVPTGLMGVLLL